MTMTDAAYTYTGVDPQGVLRKGSLHMNPEKHLIRWMTDRLDNGWHQLSVYDGATRIAFLEPVTRQLILMPDS